MNGIAGVRRDLQEDTPERRARPSAFRLKEPQVALDLIGPITEGDRALGLADHVAGDKVGAPGVTEPSLAGGRTRESEFAPESAPGRNLRLDVRLWAEAVETGPEDWFFVVIWFVKRHGSRRDAYGEFDKRRRQYGWDTNRGAL
jgi:hypothetical protein